MKVKLVEQRLLIDPTPFIPLPYKGREKNIRREAKPLFDSPQPSEVRIAFTRGNSVPSS